MNIQELQEIIKLMEVSGIAELSLEEKDLKLSLKRENRLAATGTVPFLSQTLPQAPLMTAEATTQTVPFPLATTNRSQPADASNFIIKSPMVGIFYVAPSPDSNPYVHEGSHVEGNSVVCIIEAMKVMNEVCAECSGKVLEILVKNGSPVEYGQPLFKIQLNV